MVEDRTGSHRIGIDVGGTFTDVVVLTDGEITVEKTPSTPDSPERAVVTGLAEACRTEGIDASDLDFFGHGTTVATNAVLEGTWAETALVTTEGFRDALEIGRQDRPDIYDFGAEKAPPVVERDRRFEVPERLDERGDVVRSLDTEAVVDLAVRLAALPIESVAVSLLFSFENDDHEHRVGEILSEELSVPVSLSSRVHPEIREYERTLVTALNAALAPVVDAYLDRLETRTGVMGAPPAFVMGSNGGIVTADAARDRPVTTLLSGPAAGVKGAVHVASNAGMEDVMTLDMGGTSCDVSLAAGGEPLVTTGVEVGEYPVSVPMVDVHTVGSGGGSIAWIDAGGVLRVGPRSAGADPGPICYGRGGTRPTVTDAHVLLGRLTPETFLAEEFDVGADDLRDHVEREIADPLDADVRTVAQGILDVANANVERALRVVSVERGHDPRSFALVAYGGAGPLHACEIASRLDVPRVLLPRSAGVLSALGLLVSDLLYEFATSRVRPWAAVDPADLAATYADFADDGRDRLAAAGLSRDETSMERAVDCRYVGQSYELRVPVPGGDLDEDALETVAERFHRRHERRYGHADPDEPIELVTIRLRARGHVDPPDRMAAGGDGSIEDAIVETRPVVFDGDDRETRIYDRDRLPTECEFDGPAVLRGTGSTAVVQPGQRARVTERGDVVVEVDP